MTSGDWWWKFQEATERIRTRYDHIGSKTGAPFLAIVYPPNAERAVLREWSTLAKTLDPDFCVCTIDVLEVTARVVEEIGVQSLVDAMGDPMPGSNPGSELGSLWTAAVAAAVRDAAAKNARRRPVVVLERLAALHPACGPRAVMQELWESDHTLDGPVIMLIPGILLEARVYRFVGQVEEFMYRGDIL